MNHRGAFESVEKLANWGHEGRIRETPEPRIRWIKVPFGSV